MTPEQLIEELRKLPKGAHIRYLDIEDGDYNPDGGLDWKDLEAKACVGIDWPRPEPDA